MHWIGVSFCVGNGLFTILGWFFGCFLVQNSTNWIRGLKSPWNWNWTLQLLASFVFKLISMGKHKFQKHCNMICGDTPITPISRVGIHSLFKKNSLKICQKLTKLFEKEIIYCNFFSLKNCKRKVLLHSYVLAMVFKTSLEMCDQLNQNLLRTFATLFPSRNWKNKILVRSRILHSFVLFSKSIIYFETIIQIVRGR